MKKNLLNLLDNITENEDTQEEERILIIDGFNLFFRVFSMTNTVDLSSNTHIGGLGGFLRSLGTLINKTFPTKVYIVFDGVNSSTSRKNLLPEYKSNRDNAGIINKEIFDTKESEDEAKFGQIARIVQYLKLLPVKTLILDNTEADDVISYLSTILAKDKNNKCFIVSSDKDFIQLVRENIIVYSPIIKKFYTTVEVEEAFKLPISNFILYKTLLGDQSDEVPGVKGLGKKKLFKLFPELQEKKLTMDDLHEICEGKFKEHLIYARFLQDFEQLKVNYKIMDLTNPLMDEEGKKYVRDTIKETQLNFNTELFLLMAEEDGLERLIRNPQYWVKDIFENLVVKSK